MVVMSLEKERKNISVDLDIYNELVDVKNHMRFKSFNDLIRHLLEFYKIHEVKRLNKYVCDNCRHFVMPLTKWFEMLSKFFPQNVIYSVIGTTLVQKGDNFVVNDSICTDTVATTNLTKPTAVEPKTEATQPPPTQSVAPAKEAKTVSEAEEEESVEGFSYISLYDEKVAEDFWSKISSKLRVTESMIPYRVEASTFRKVVESVLSDIDYGTAIDVLETNGYITVEKNYIIVNKPTIS